jgi:hypothetical protein
MAQATGREKTAPVCIVKQAKHFSAQVSEFIPLTQTETFFCLLFFRLFALENSKHTGLRKISTRQNYLS